MAYDEDMFEKWCAHRDLKDTIRENIVDPQIAKADQDKPRLSLVDPSIITAIAKVREYGTKKYGDPDNWKKVSFARYKDAMLRHTLAFWKDSESVDEESGLPHLYHMACNLSFLIAMMQEEK